MKTIVVLAHPHIEQSGVNKTWTSALVQKHPEVKLHNLYTKYPDWKFDVQAEQALLEQYDRIILEFPVQWYSVTPLLKKWLDDIFLQGWCYGEGGNKLAGKQIGIALSTAGVAEAYTEEVYGTVAQILKPLESTVKFVGAEYISHHVFHGAYTPDASERLAEDVEKYIDFVTK